MSFKFIKLAVAAIPLLTMPFAAQAADMPIKAPPVAPVWWTGGYVGGNVGYSWGRSKSTETISSAANVPLSTTNSKFNMNGLIAGGQLGYNWQNNNWVFGVEGDYQWSGQKGSTTFTCPTGVCSPPFGLLAVFPGPAMSGTLSEKLQWFATLRGRAGFLIKPTVLVYGTGGVAYGSIKSDLTLSIPATANTFSSSTNKVGWTAGAGIESKLNSNWSVKLEYLYVDLGTVSTSFATTIPALGGGFAGLSSHSKITDNIVRAGVNYQFTH